MIVVLSYFYHSNFHSDFDLPGPRTPSSAKKPSTRKYWRNRELCMKAVASCIFLGAGAQIIHVFLGSTTIHHFLKWIKSHTSNIAVWNSPQKPRWLRQASAQPARSRGSLPSSRPGDLSAEMFHRNHQERWTCWTPETCGENIIELASEIDTFRHWNPNYCNLLIDCPLHVDLDNPPSTFTSFSHKNNVFQGYIGVHVEPQAPDINL